MAHYRVSWGIDIEAGTPQQAARQALAIQRDPESTATVFDVCMVGPCPACKQHVVHSPSCRIFRRDHYSLLIDSIQVDVAKLEAK